MKINVYGSSMSAWVAAACLAKVGNDVVIDEMLEGRHKKLESISILQDEPGLLEQIQREIRSGRLRRRELQESVSSDIHWLALQPTEQMLAEKVIDDFKANDEEALLIVNQCNFVVGATAILQAKLGEGHEMIYIPDNLQEGKALKGFSHPKRIILGLDKDSSLAKAKALLRPFSNDLGHLQVMSTREAEFTKFAITGMLALRLGYINELANLADLMDVDVSVVQEGMGADPRVGHHYLSPGCGFGGQNFDAYVSTFSGILEKERQQSLLKTVVEENEAQKELLFRKLWQHYEGDLEGKVVAIWGVSFKPGTASIENAPSLKIINALISQGVRVNVHDPEALVNLRTHFGSHPLINYSASPLAAAADADALMLVTEWPLYWSPDYEALAEIMQNPLIIDGRNIFEKELLAEYGFNYLGVGR